MVNRHENEMNQETFLRTLLPLQPAMQLMAERLLHSAVDAEDAVQEVFIDLWEKRDELRHVHNLEGYAMQAVKNRCRSLLRSRGRVLSLDELANMEIPDEAATIAEAALTEERAATLDRMMERLPDTQRQAVRMRYIDQLSHEEMQRQLHMSSSNVYTTLSRAMSALKSMIKQ